MSHRREHEILRSKLERLKSTYDPIFNRHHNGNAEVNNELKACLKAIYGLDDAFEMHDERTDGDDEKLDKYKSFRRQRNWAWGLFLAIVPTLLTILFNS